MAWLEIKLYASKDQAETWSEYFNKYGALAVTLEDAENQMLVEEHLGVQKLWEKVIITAMFDDKVNVIELKQKLATFIDQETLEKLTYTHLADKDWIQTVTNNFKPIAFGSNKKKLWICPSWSTMPQPNDINIILDPGLAFGTGSHPTTNMCLNWLVDNLHQDASIIDYGCGSGILAIAAYKLGAQKVYAIDIDPQALTSTNINADKNLKNKKDNFFCIYPDKLPSVQVDIVIANILCNPLLELAENFNDLLKTNGKIVLSGILNNQVEIIKQKYSKWFYNFKYNSQEDWACLEATKL